MTDKASSQKACTACGVSFPLSTFTYRKRDNRPWCPACDAGYSKAYAAGGKEAGTAYIREQQRKWK